MKLPTMDNPVRILTADSRLVLADMQDGECDHIISDPPYSAKTHKGARTTVSGPKFQAVDLVKFDALDGPSFIAFCRQAVRVAKRWVVMTCDWRHAAMAEEQMPDEFIRCGIWIKGDSAPQFTGDRPGTGWEAVLILHRKGKKRWNGGGHHAVWNFNTARDQSHPTGKPLELFRKWVRDFTDPGDLIVDPYCGSGTTPLACAYEGRRCLGIELNEEYASIARRRVGKLLASDGLLAYRPRPVVVKESLFD